jgi:hypothetical protein
MKHLYSNYESFSHSSLKGVVYKGGSNVTFRTYELVFIAIPSIWDEFIKTGQPCGSLAGRSVAPSINLRTSVTFLSI